EGTSTRNPWAVGSPPLLNLIAASNDARYSSSRLPFQGPATESALPGAQRRPVHLDPVAVRVKALERHVGRFIFPFRNGDAISLHVFHQRAHVNWRGGLEAGMQERRRRLDVSHRVQGQVEPVCIADDDSAVLILLGGGRVEAEIGRIEPLAT